MSSVKSMSVRPIDQPPKVLARVVTTWVEAETPIDHVVFLIDYNFARNEEIFIPGGTVSVSVNINQSREQIETAIREAVADEINLILEEQDYPEYNYSANDIRGCGI